MDIKSYIEQQIFRYSKIPKNPKATPNPKGYYMSFDMKKITIGDMPWKKGWQKNWVQGKDPDFRDSLPWDANISSPDNIIKTNEGITLVQPKEKDAKSAYLVSNFTIKYGTIRAMIKCPTAKGVWSAFWLFGNNGMPECDIMEHCGGWKNEVAVTHHWGVDYGEQYGKKSTLHNTRYNKGFTPRDGYYLYEVELSPYRVLYRINGVTVRTVKKGVPSGDNMIIFDVVKGNYCGTTPNQAIEKDGEMKIKYIEIFKIK